MFNYLSIENLHQFEVIKSTVIFIVLESFVHYQSGDDITKELRAGELQDREESFLSCTVVNPFLELIVVALPENYEQGKQ